VVAEAKLGLTLHLAHQYLQLQVLRPEAETQKLHKLPFLHQGLEISFQEEQTRLVIVFLSLRMAVLAARQGQMVKGKMAVTVVVIITQAGTVEAEPPTFLLVNPAVLAQRVAQHLAALAVQDVWVLALLREA
jgi:hypothetical protein